MQIKAIMAI